MNEYEKTKRENLLEIKRTEIQLILETLKILESLMNSRISLLKKTETYYNFVLENQDQESDWPEATEIEATDLFHDQRNKLYKFMEEMESNLHDLEVTEAKLELECDIQDKQEIFHAIHKEVDKTTEKFNNLIQKNWQYLLD